jgi:pimeloyl-ACP methyl ester carboxylesterase
MNLQVIASPHGEILRVSGALPGSVHDKKAEWVWGVPDELEKAGLVTLADKGYQGRAWAKVPYKGRNKPEPQKEANRAHAKTPRPRRARERAAQGMEDPHQAPMLPLARRETRESNPRIAAPRGLIRLESAHCVSEFIREDYSDDLKKISVPVLAMNGGGDQIAPTTPRVPEPSNWCRTAR